MKLTKDIEKEYSITRQTLHNWIKEGLISAPQKDWRGWFIWTESNEMEICNIMTTKEFQNNKIKLEKKKEKLKLFNRRYLGSKQKMLDFIEKVVNENTTNVNSVADIFGGTGAVADLFRAKGKKIIINDILQSNYQSYITWFGNSEVDYEKIERYINELNNLQVNEDNYVSINYGDKYFSMDNARKIGAIRDRIEEFTDLNEREKSFLITSLIYAMDKVANTVGHYDAYRKNMDSFNPIFLRVPELNLNNENEIFCTDANKLVREIKADLVYIDTPYNSRQYGDAYHLLENITEWNKPEVTGVAMKMINRQHIKSNYSTQKAPIAFDDLIQNIDAKYILVSYNNMAKKGNCRSNAKISNEEIISILKKRGEVTVFETPFQAFTTGMSNIEDHKELLYLCKVKTKNHYVKSAINYTGGKYKLLPQIKEFFPDEYDNFIDLFSGGANVGINANPKNKIYINDIEPRLIELYKLLKDISFDEVHSKVNEIIKQYNFSDTKTFGYDYYELRSNDGVGKYNKENYLKLRNEYNKGLFDDDRFKPIYFYVLIIFGFNNQIRFNKKGEFNLPVGKRDFNEKMVEKLYNFQKTLKEKDFVFSSRDFREFTAISNNDFVYVDPPYLISTASYNENGGWKAEDEMDLLNFLDNLSMQGVRWALSNVLIHKGQENTLLIEWSKKYQVNLLDYNYNNSNYHTKAKDNKTQEILIINY